MTGAFYINGVSLSSATSVYVDSAMTIYAPNGIYQQDGITRQLIDGVLQPPQICPSCSYPCGDYPVEGGTVEGVYLATTNVGSGTGAVIVQVTSETKPNGFIVQYNSANYNQFSSPNYGLLAATSGATYLGTIADDCGIVASSPHTLDQYEYVDSAFVATGNQEVIDIVTAQNKTTVGAPDTCIMVIPKTSSSPSTLEVTVYSPCPNGDFTVEVSCPSPLDGFTAGGVESSITAACETVAFYTRYVAYVNGSGGVLGLYDWVFSDENGQNILPNGYYYATLACPSFYDIFRIENGVIVEFIECIELPYEVDIDFAGGCELNITNLRMQVFFGVIPKLDVYYPETGSIPILAGTYNVILGFTYAAITGGCCDMKLVIEYGGVEIITSLLPTPPSNGVYYSVSTPITITTTETLKGYIRCV